MGETTEKALYKHNKETMVLGVNRTIFWILDGRQWIFINHADNCSFD